MNRITYKEANDKIIQAYFKVEIKPMSVCFCFCGTLAYNTEDNDKWCCGVETKMYTSIQYGKMEAALLKPLIPYGIFPPFDNVVGTWYGKLEEDKEGYEDALFQGMCDALDVLKEIHRERGEDVDNEPITFKKRELTLKS